MDDTAFWGKLREIIREEITAAMQTYFIPAAIPEEEILIGTAELCRELKLSRQTLYNWLKHPKTRPLLAANRQKTGNKVLYNITGIKAAIKKNPVLFGGGRDYAFKDEAVLLTPPLLVFRLGLRRRLVSRPTADINKKSAAVVGVFHQQQLGPIRDFTYKKP